MITTNQYPDPYYGGNQNDPGLYQQNQYYGQNDPAMYQQQYQQPNQSYQNQYEQNPFQQQQQPNLFGLAAMGMNQQQNQNQNGPVSYGYWFS